MILWEHLIHNSWLSHTLMSVLRFLFYKIDILSFIADTTRYQFNQYSKVFLTRKKKKQQKIHIFVIAIGVELWKCI